MCARIEKSVQTMLCLGVSHLNLLFCAILFDVVLSYFPCIICAQFIWILKFVLF